MESRARDADDQRWAPGGVGALGEPGGPARPDRAAPDPVLAALLRLEEVLERNVAAERALGEQVRQLRARHERGLSWREAMDQTTGPTGVLSLLGDLLVRLTDAGAVLRRALAAALLAEGASTAEVAQRFGVSRQRVFRLLQGKGSVGRDEPGTGDAPV